MVTVEPIGNIQCKWGEGPIWWQNALYFVDIEGHRVHRFDPADGSDRSWNVGERVGTVVPRESGGLVIAGDHGLHFLDEETVHTSPNGKNRTFSCTHCFSNMIICGNCGEVFRRVHWNNRGKKSVVWRCVSRLENTGRFCDARTVPESQIELILVNAINQSLSQKNTFLATLQENIETVLSRENNQPLIDIELRLQELQQELLRLASSKADYEEVGAEIHRLHDEKQKLQLEGAGRDDIKKRISDMSTFLMDQSTVLTEYDEALVRQLIEKITVYDDKLTVEFKSGVTVDLE
ncbi:SMP-30/gluconolactonase/LRE family protein [Acetobacterium malicum]|uniref:SMP-30/gluconolactonase/LRE family protein n=1 Tax=Acetobacterium malicum TaxID=52692 RepID=UPI0035944914